MSFRVALSVQCIKISLQCTDVVAKFCDVVSTKYQYRVGRFSGGF